MGELRAAIEAVVPDCHCQHVTGGRCMFAASPPKPEPLTPERLAAIGKVSYEPTIDQLAIKGRIARGAADYEGFLMAMSPYIRVEESVREAHAGSRSADSSTTPDADAPVSGLAAQLEDTLRAASWWEDAHGEVVLLSDATDAVDTALAAATSAEGNVPRWVSDRVRRLSRQTEPPEPELFDCPECDHEVALGSAQFHAPRCTLGARARPAGEGSEE